MSETQAPVTVHQAWAAVMGDVRELGKNQTNTHQKFNFRGVDDVMNAVGPALRRHGVMVVPASVELHTRDAQTTQGKAAHETTVVVQYTIYGPAGDSMPGASAGESLDSGDKATPKAMSVAFRTFLLQSLCLPTDDKDPDAETYERTASQQQQDHGPTPGQQAQTTADGLPNCDDVAALGRVKVWAQERGLLGLEVRYDSAQGEATAKLGVLFDMHEQRLVGVAA